MVESHELPASTPLLLSRLRLADESRLKSHFACEGYDQETQANVIIAREPKVTGQAVEPLGTITHPHLVPVVAVLAHQDDNLVISSALKGTQLSRKIADEGRLRAVESVRMVLRITDALSHLHEKGIFHGRVHPENVLVGLPDAANPSLVYGSRCPAAFTRPERADWTSPVEACDDTWAATGLLYFALSSALPPREGLADEADLDNTFIDDPLLREVLLHGLSQDPERRAKTLFAVRRELARWFIAHAADEPITSVAFSHKPPPLPASLAPSPPSATSGRPQNPTSIPTPEHSQRPSLRSQSAVAPPKTAWLRLTPMAAIAAIVGLSAAWGLALIRKGSPTVVVKNTWVAAPTAVATASTGPIDLAEVPVTGEEHQSNDATTSCVKGYLREGTLIKGAKLESLCKESELPQTLGMMRSAFAATNNPNAPMLSRFETLAWYSLPTLTGLRQACCGDSVTALKLPELASVCPDFSPALETLSRAVSSSQSLDTAIRRYETAAQCVAKSGRAPGISAGPPGPVSERAFRELFATQPTNADSAVAHTPDVPPVGAANPLPAQTATPSVASAAPQGGDEKSEPSAPPNPGAKPDVGSVTAPPAVSAP